ncbi:MAG: hypothetical protein LDLANPLL_01614 [Turneriella sp.]|nr:hypothetical protein [Turneriella sp.]
MGNENKVNHNLTEVKSRFLPSDIHDPNAKGEVYVLDREFAAAAKNRSWAFYLIIFGFLAAIVVATLIITHLLQGKHNQVDLAIMEFEEIKLKDILNATRNDEKNLEVARHELESLREKYREALAELKARKATEAEINRVRTDYNGKILAQQKIVADYEGKVVKRRHEMNEGVAKVENILSNHERLMKLRLDKQQAEYEKKIADLILRYNPHFTEAALKKMVATERLTTKTPPPALVTLPPELFKERVISKEKFEKLRALEGEERRLIARLRQVPYINSVAPALTGIERRNSEVMAQYETLVAELAKTIKRKNEVLGNYRTALRELTEREREYGYIIDPRNKAKMRVYLNPSLRAKKGLRANIFRKDDEYIADIEIFFDSEGPCAKVLNIAEGKAIAAFDKIYLEDR